MAAPLQKGQARNGEEACIRFFRIILSVTGRGIWLCCALRCLSFRGGDDGLEPVQQSFCAVRADHDTEPGLFGIFAFTFLTDTGNFFDNAGERKVAFEIIEFNVYGTAHLKELKIGLRCGGFDTHPVIQVVFRNEPMISLCGDENALLRLVVILLDNAMKYSTDTGDIALHLERQGKKARLTVENSIEGIDPTTLENLFERFYRSDMARGKQEGYGIGLSIAKAIVEAHKGKITAATPGGRTLMVTR